MTAEEVLVKIGSSCNSRENADCFPDKALVVLDDFYPFMDCSSGSCSAGIFKNIEQLKKLPKFIELRRANHIIFKKLFENHPYIQIQKEIGESSWFGFSMILKPDAPLTRNQLIKKLHENNIECRPVVSGDFTQNEVLKYFDYSIHGELKNAQYLNENGFFIGNNPIDLKEELEFVFKVLN